MNGNCESPLPCLLKFKTVLGQASTWNRFWRDFLEAWGVPRQTSKKFAPEGFCVEISTPRQLLRSLGPLPKTSAPPSSLTCIPPALFPPFLGEQGKIAGSREPGQERHSQDSFDRTTTTSSPARTDNIAHDWETDFYTPPVLRGAALSPFSAPAVYKNPVP